MAEKVTVVIKGHVTGLLMTVSERVCDQPTVAGRVTVGMDGHGAGLLMTVSGRV